MPKYKKNFSDLMSKFNEYKRVRNEVSYKRKLLSDVISATIKEDVKALWELPLGINMLKAQIRRHLDDIASNDEAIQWVVLDCMVDMLRLTSEALYKTDSNFMRRYIETINEVVDRLEGIDLTTNQSFQEELSYFIMDAISNRNVFENYFSMVTTENLDRMARTQAQLPKHFFQTLQRHHATLLNSSNLIKVNVCYIKLKLIFSKQYLSFDRDIAHVEQLFFKELKQTILFDKWSKEGVSLRVNLAELSIFMILLHMIKNKCSEFYVSFWPPMIDYLGKDSHITLKEFKKESWQNFLQIFETIISPIFSEIQDLDMDLLAEDYCQMQKMRGIEEWFQTILPKLKLFFNDHNQLKKIKKQLRKDKLYDRTMKIDFSEYEKVLKFYNQFFIGKEASATPVLSYTDDNAQQMDAINGLYHGYVEQYDNACFKLRQINDPDMKKAYEVLDSLFYEMRQTISKVNKLIIVIANTRLVRAEFSIMQLKLTLLYGAVLREINKPMGRSILLPIKAIAPIYLIDNDLIAICNQFLKQNKLINAQIASQYKYFIQYFFYIPEAYGYINQHALDIVLSRKDIHSSFKTLYYFHSYIEEWPAKFKAHLNQFNDDSSDQVRELWLVFKKQVEKSLRHDEQVSLAEWKLGDILERIESRLIILALNVHHAKNKVILLDRVFQTYRFNNKNADDLSQEDIQNFHNESLLGIKQTLIILDYFNLIQCDELHKNLFILNDLKDAINSFLSYIDAYLSGYQFLLNSSQSSIKQVISHDYLLKQKITLNQIKLQIFDVKTKVEQSDMNQEQRSRVSAEVEGDQNKLDLLNAEAAQQFQLKDELSKKLAESLIENLKKAEQQHQQRLNLSLDADSNMRQVVRSIIDVSDIEADTDNLLPGDNGQGSPSQIDHDQQWVARVGRSISQQNANELLIKYTEIETYALKKDNVILQLQALDGMSFAICRDLYKDLNMIYKAVNQRLNAKKPWKDYKGIKIQTHLKQVESYSLRLNEIVHKISTLGHSKLELNRESLDFSLQVATDALHVAQYRIQEIKILCNELHELTKQTWNEFMLRLADKMEPKPEQYHTYSLSDKYELGYQQFQEGRIAYKTKKNTNESLNGIIKKVGQIQSILSVKASAASQQKKAEQSTEIDILPSKNDLIQNIKLPESTSSYIIMNTLRRLFDDRVAYHHVFIKGGCAADIFNQARPCDIDLLVQTTPDILISLGACESRYLPGLFQLWDAALKMKIDINLVEHDVQSNVDYHHCGVLIDLNGTVFFDSPIAKRAVLNQELILNGPADRVISESPVRLLRALHRVAAHQYRCSDELKSQLIQTGFYILKLKLPYLMAKLNQYSANPQQRVAFWAAMFEFKLVDYLLYNQADAIDADTFTRCLAKYLQLDLTQPDFSAFDFLNKIFELTRQGVSDDDRERPYFIENNRFEPSVKRAYPGSQSPHFFKPHITETTDTDTGLAHTALSQ